MKKFTFLIPLYNDWQNLKILIEKIEIQLQRLDDEFDMIILNDFFPEFINRRKNATKTISYNKYSHLKNQLYKANTYCNRVKEYL